MLNIETRQGKINSTTTKLTEGKNRNTKSVSVNNYLNLTGFNSSIRTHREVEQIFKNNKIYAILSLVLKDSNILKVKGYKKILHANGKQQEKGQLYLLQKIVLNSYYLIRQRRILYSGW